MTPDRRADARHDMFRIGELLCTDRDDLVNCLVRNHSKSGALIEVKETEGLPDAFRLVVPSIGLRRGCRVVRRTAHMLGVAFAA